MIGLTYTITRTPLGRSQRACEQDRFMAALLGVNVDRTISLTFVMGAVLAAVAGVMVSLYYGVIDFFIGFLAGLKAFTAAVLGGIGSLPGAMLGGIMIGLIEAFWSAYFSDRVQGRRRVRHPRPRADLQADRHSRPSGSREGLRPMSATATTSANPRAGLDVVALLKDAGLTAFVALILAIPLVGFETFDKSGSTSLGLRTRFGAVAIGVVAVFFGRLAMQVWRQTMLTAQPGQVPLWDRLAGSAPKVKLPFGPLLVGFAVIVPIVWSSNAYVVDIGITVLIYVMLGWGLNVVVGLAGLLDLGYVAFYAVGAYSYALLYHHFGLTFWECLPLAGLFAAAFGVILGFPVLRLRGDYLAIVTLGFGEIIRVIVINWSDFTGGPNGIASIPRPSFFGMPFQAVAPEGKSTFATFFGLEFTPDPPGHLPLLRHPGSRPADQLRHAAPAQAAGRARLGSVARGRDRLPLARHQPDQHQADRLRHRRLVRRFRRRLLRHAPGLHQPRELHLHRKRDDPGHRRAGRHGQPARHRARRTGPAVVLPEFWAANSPSTAC
jgi:ABC-type branched-subunit amino acid transport system permease subunit